MEVIWTSRKHHNRGVQFVVGIIKELNDLLEIQTKLSTAYYPKQIDKQRE